MLYKVEKVLEKTVISGYEICFNTLAVFEKLELKQELSLFS